MQSKYTKHFQDGQQQGSDLVVGAVKHQRDLFSGSSLGIPDVNTHVGSVVHAFETLAHQRKPGSTERQKSAAPQPPTSSSSVARVNELGHKIVLPATTADDDGGFGREKSGDESGGFSNLDTLSYKIDNNYRKSGFGGPPTNSNQQTATRIPTIIPASMVAATSSNNHRYHPKRELSSTPIRSMRPRKLTAPSAAVEEVTQNYENDFIRGSTVSQSFVKNVKLSKSGGRRSVFEQNVTKITKHPPGGTARIERKLKARSVPEFDEVAQRYTEHAADRRSQAERRRTFVPTYRDRAEI